MPKPRVRRQPTRVKVPAPMPIKPAGAADVKFWRGDLAIRSGHRVVSLALNSRRVHLCCSTDVGCALVLATSLPFGATFLACERGRARTWHHVSRTTAV